MDFRLLSDLPENLSGKFILLRADLNVPVQNNEVSDYTRIDRLKPSINFLKAKNARIIILSHFGRPKGQPDPEYSLSFLAPILQERWSSKVSFSNDCCGEKTEKDKLCPTTAFGRIKIDLNSTCEAVTKKFTSTIPKNKSKLK